MDLRKVKRYIELAEQTGLAELEVSSERGAGPDRVHEHVRIVRVHRPAAAVVPVPEEAAAVVSESSAARTGEVVASPMSGTFYRAPAPGQSPFVEVGDTVAVGDVLCIVESMKMMNQIESEYAGQVSAVLLADGVPIETGTPLFRIA